MNSTLTLSPRSRTAAPAAVAIIYPKVGTVLRVPLPSPPAGRFPDHQQHPERQFITWFNRMSGARPGFAMQIRRIQLITAAPLCQSCYQVLTRFLSCYHLADSLQLHSLASAPPVRTAAAGASCSCGCGYCGHQDGRGPLDDPNSNALNALLLDDFISDSELEEEGWWRRLKQAGQAAALTGALVLGPQGAFKPVYDAAKAVASVYERRNKMQRTVEAATPPSLRPPGQQELGYAQELGYEFADVLPACASPGSARPTLRLGARGEYVRYLQCRLNYHRVSLLQPLLLDGVWGPKTQAAVRSFQQGRGLVVDAVVGPLTWGQLDAGRPVVPTVPPKKVPGGNPPLGGTDVNTVRFRNAADINAFFLAKTGQDFVDWFRSKVGGRGAWAGRNLGAAGVKTSFQQLWDNIPAIFDSFDINFAQFAALQSIATNETGNMRPISENVGPMGLAYPFNVVKLKNGRTKGSYNRKPNFTAYDLFSNRDYVRAHSQKALANRLTGTQDKRWEANVYPTDFPADPAMNVTGFIGEADFYKFRGRGFIQTTWRSNYLNLVRYVQAYEGADPVIRRFRQAWQGLTPDVAATVSSNLDWDALFQQSQEFALKALKIYFDRARGQRRATSIDSVQVGNWPSVRAVAIDVAGGHDPIYHDLFERRVRQIFDTLGATPTPVGPGPGALAGGVGPLPGPATSATETARREAIVANALGMMAEPTIEAKVRGADGLRKGWQKLKVMFETAAPVYFQPGWEENNLKRSTAVSNTAGIPHWCGIFALWAHRAAGLNVGTWIISKGIGSNPAFRSIPAAQVKKGDVGYYNLDPATKQPFRHHFLVREVYPDGTMDTIEGNSGATSTVRSRSRVPMRGVDLFFTAF
ncbi:peptidoglycan-binding domain-containing protein [Hymenobacter sp. M29]|uniref:Peptidoglycan-binding domain-containing protein n=1 Tax=Hymenobacter mellowenesis TaxID=3063995 RepID=A0ABT9ACE6_9BACT|nr:peptidoglycan-binding protein [Hymenobacter sp. M29]MDO7847523.1 peptidoglycan-binding domain-containing protein [Hymenobacter sp. M29]